MSETDPSERERRQYQLMVDRLRKFQEGQLHLGTLVDDLDALWWQLEETADEWKEAFREEWGVLEEVHAGVRNRADKTLAPDELWLVQQAIVKITALLRDVGAGTGRETDA